MNTIRLILCSCFFGLMTSSIASACGGILIDTNGGSASDSCWGTKVTDGAITITLSLDTLAILAAHMENEYRGDDPAVVALNRMLSLVSEPLSGGSLDMKYPSHNGNCEYRLANGRIAKVLPLSRCASIKYIIGWRISELMDELRTASILGPGGIVSVYRQAFLATNKSHERGEPFLTKAVFAMVLGNTLLPDAEQKKLNGLVAELDSWTVEPLFSMVDTLPIEATGFSLKWAGDYMALATSNDQVLVGAINYSALKAWEITNERSTWQLYQAGLAARLLADTDDAMAAANVALSHSQMYQFNKEDGFQSLPAGNVTANRGAMEGLIAAGYSPMEVDRLLSEFEVEAFFER